MYTAIWISKLIRRLLYAPSAIRLDVGQAIASSLAGHDELGMHTNIYHFTGLGKNATRRCYEYIWGSRTSRPFGIILPNCKECSGNLTYKKVSMFFRVPC